MSSDSYVVVKVRYDTRGHGRSGKPEDAAAWESKRLAEDFDAVVRGFGLSRPFVACWCVLLSDSCASSDPNMRLSLVGVLEVSQLASLDETATEGFLPRTHHY